VRYRGAKVWQHTEPPDFATAIWSALHSKSSL
jgi:hypothetical protein